MQAFMAQMAKKNAIGPLAFMLKEDDKKIDMS